MYKQDEFLAHNAKNALANQKREQEERKLALIREQRLKELKQLETQTFYKKQEVERLRVLMDRLKREAVSKQNKYLLESRDIQNQDSKFKEVEQRLASLDAEVNSSISSLSDKISQEKSKIIEHQRILDRLQSEQKDLLAKDVIKKRSIAESLMRIASLKRAKISGERKTDATLDALQKEQKSLDTLLPQKQNELVQLEQKVLSKQTENTNHGKTNNLLDTLQKEEKNLNLNHTQKENEIRQLEDLLRHKKQELLDLEKKAAFLKNKILQAQTFDKKSDQEKFVQEKEARERILQNKKQEIVDLGKKSQLLKSRIFQLQALDKQSEDQARLYDKDIKQNEEQVKQLDLEISQKKAQFDQKIAEHKAELLVRQRKIEELEKEKYLIQENKETKKKTISEMLSKLIFSKKKEERESEEAKKVFEVGQKQIQQIEQSLKVFTQEITVLENKIKTLKSSIK